MEEALRVGETGHARWQLKALYDATENGAIQWVSVKYLKRVSDGGGFLPCRQEVPADGFLTLEEVKNQALRTYLPLALRTAPRSQGVPSETARRSFEERERAST